MNRAVTQKHNHRRFPAGFSETVIMLVEDVESGQVLWEARIGSYGNVTGIKTSDGQAYWATVGSDSVRVREAGLGAPGHTIERSLAISVDERRELVNAVVKQLDKHAAEREALRIANNADSESGMASMLRRLRGR